MPTPAWLLSYNQMELFEGSNDKKLTLGLTRVIVGQFYEILLQQHVKGILNDHQAQAGIRPDVIVNHKISPDIYEVKAGRTRIICDHLQWEYYNKLKENDFPYHKPNIFYALFFHSVHCLKDCETVSDLIKKLCVSTVFGIILPLDTINIMVEEDKKRYYGKSWSCVNRADKAGMHKHEYYSILNFNRICEDATLRTTYLRLRAMKVAGNKVNQFPFYKFV